MCCNQRYEHMSNYVRYYFYMISRRLFIMKEVIHTSNAPAAIGPYSQAIKAGGAIYVSGQLPVDPATGAFAGDTIQEQTRQPFKSTHPAANAKRGELQPATAIRRI